ncbi:hypothetical protein ACFRAU_16790 [Arthrobacter sp. NPDC056691]
MTHVCCHHVGADGVPDLAPAIGEVTFRLTIAFAGRFRVAVSQCPH